MALDPKRTFLVSLVPLRESGGTSHASHWLHLEGHLSTGEICPLTFTRLPYAALAPRVLSSMNSAGLL
jgi:hypothetical protein